MPFRLSTEFDPSAPDLIAVLDDLALWSAPFGLKLLEVVRLRRGLLALDVGTGCGFPGLELSQRLGTSSRVFGLDPWRAALQRARAKQRFWRVSNLHLVSSRAETLPFGSACFDLLVSNNGTNNVDDEARTYAELARVAKPGAQMVLTMNLPGTMIEFYSTLEAVLNELGRVDHVVRMREHIHEKRKPLDHLERVLDAAGFALEAAHQDVFVLRFLDGTTMLQHFLIRLAFLESWVQLLAPEDVDAVFDRVEYELNDWARRHGQLELSVPWVCLDCRRRSNGR